MGREAPILLMEKGDIIPPERDPLILPTQREDLILLLEGNIAGIGLSIIM